MPTPDSVAPALSSRGPGLRRGSGGFGGLASGLWALLALLWLLDITGRLHAPWVGRVSVAVAVPFIVAAFSGLGLLAAGTTMLVRRLNPVAMVIGSLSFFLSGVMYPVTVPDAFLVERQVIRRGERPSSIGCSTSPRPRWCPDADSAGWTTTVTWRTSGLSSSGSPLA